ncbi:MAG: hypothetical protein Q9201_007948 [Fulgogasparrea decipioides]
MVQPKKKGTSSTARGSGAPEEDLAKLRKAQAAKTIPPKAQAPAAPAKQEVRQYQSTGVRVEDLPKDENGRPLWKGQSLTTQADIDALTPSPPNTSDEEDYENEDDGSIERGLSIKPPKATKSPKSIPTKKVIPTEKVTTNIAEPKGPKKVGAQRPSKKTVSTKTGTGAIEAEQQQLVASKDEGPGYKQHDQEEETDAKLEAPVQDGPEEPQLTKGDPRLSHKRAREEEYERKLDPHPFKVPRANSGRSRLPKRPEYDTARLESESEDVMRRS